MLNTITTTVLIGLSGVGKSMQVMTLEDAYVLSPDHREDSMFRMYDGEANLVIEDFDGWIGYSYLRRLMTTPGMQLKTSFGLKWGDWDNIYITSRYRPRHWYKPGINTSLVENSITHIYEVIRDGNTYPINQPRDRLWAWANHLQTPYELKRA